MRATFASLTIAALSFLSLAACSDRRNDLVAPMAVDTLPRYYMCPAGTIRCVPPPPPVNIQAIHLSAGSAVTCAVHVTFDASAGVTTPTGRRNRHHRHRRGVHGRCWSSILQHEAEARSLSHLRGLLVGGQHVCATKLDGNAYCWGDNSSARSACPLVRTHRHLFSARRSFNPRPDRPRV